MLYVSPLKALNYDIERNLRGPLAGLESTLRVGVRTGDTPAKERRELVQEPARHPDHDARVALPDAHVGGARDAARGRDADPRRGARRRRHEARRASGAVGRAARARRRTRRSSASASPRRSGRSRRSAASSRAAGRSSSSTRARARSSTSRSSSRSRTCASSARPRRSRTRAGRRPEMDAGTEHGSQSIWPSIYPELLRLVEAHRSTIVFVNNRRLAERLALRLNELRRRREEIARAHHGSLAREQRVLVEEELKAGRIPCLVATSSLELGIDMGAVDLVIQVESPKSVARGLQRIGRAGHELGAVSKGRIFPKFRADLLESAVVARAMRAGEIEETKIPRNPLDVLAQQIVAISADEEIAVDDLHELVRRAYPFADLSRAQLENVLDMLAGPLPVRRVRRAAAAHRLGPHRRHDPRARRGAPARRHERRHDPRPRALRRLPGRRRRPRRRARRGDGLRGARRPDVPPRRLDLADRGDHARPRDRLAGARAARRGAVLEGRGRRPAVRARPEDRRRLARAVGARRRRRRTRACARSSCSTTARRKNLLAFLREQARRHRRGAHRPHDRGRALPRRDRRLARLHPLAVRRPRARAVGDGDHGAAARVARRSRRSRSGRTTASRCTSPTPTRRRRSPTC